MGHLIDHYYHVAWLAVGVLVRLAMEDVLLAVWRALVDGDLYDLLLLDHLLAIAVLALVGLVNAFARAIAVRAGASRLGVHARSQHSHLGPHSSSLAARAGGVSAVRTALALALATDSVSVDGDFALLSIVDFLEGDLNGVLDRLSLLGPLVSFSSTEAEHLGENVSAAPHSTSVLEALLAILVVKLSLILVAQGLIGRGDLLELLGIASFVGMVLEG
mmetsp:Transcript_16341/g.27642  ORF Transcript_16341/g.27642 Transcript_16341/m.27642 type:complete len:218 (-) Transcript_16341:198-851(-)